MPSEVELKLALPAALNAKVPRLPWLRKLRCGPERRERLDTVYFDTPSGKLHKHGVTLRIRHAGPKRVQTIKAMSDGAGSSFGRGEWEHEISGDRPDLALASGTPLEPLITKKLRRRLAPVFATSVERSRIPIRCEDAELEFAVDRGQIKRYGRRRISEPISEIEIEVKKGDPLQLCSVAGRLARSVEVAYCPVAKAERGYALINRESHKPVRARPVALSAKLSAAEAFKRIGLACLDHALANDRAVHAGDAEGVHQMRIGLRRLRATLSIFKELLHGPEPRSVKEELKWLTNQMGPAREVDVLLQEHVAPLRNRTPVAAEANLLSRSLNVERDAGLAKAQAALETERYRMLGLNTVLWLVDGAWSRTRNSHVAACRDRPIQAFAGDVLRRRAKKLIKKAQRIEELNARQRHKLRIASKKLRYSAEFFAALVSDKRQSRHKRFLRILKTFQGALGRLNDMEAHKNIARRIARPVTASPSQSRKSLAIGYIAGQEQAEVASCLAVIDKVAKKPLPKFWQ